MKKLLVVLSIMLVAGMLFGCGDKNTTTTGNAAPDTSNKYQDQTGTLQGKIMNATTGAPIGNDENSDLKVWIIQGTDNRSASKLITDNNDPLCGEYAISGIPINLHYGNATFKVVVVKPGFQRFEADVEMTANRMTFTSGSQAGEGPFFNSGIDTTLDSVINMIGNIYLFPIGVQSGDQQIYVHDDFGTPIPNAQITIIQNVENNSATVATNDQLDPTAGLYTTLSVTTNADGLATVSGTQLVLGGDYDVYVAAMTFQGVVLDDATSSFYVDSANQPLRITMYTDASNLFATSATNEYPNTITSTGTLVITFNQPIGMSTTGCTVGIYSATDSGIITVGTLTYNASSPNGNAAPVQASLAADGLSVTLTAPITTHPTDKGAYLTYTCTGSVRRLDSQEAPNWGGRQLFNGYIKDVKTGYDINGTVQLTSY